MIKKHPDKHKSTKAHPIVKHMGFANVALVCAGATLTGCASNKQTGLMWGSIVLGVPGFFAGFFHGFITPIAVFPWLALKGLLWLLDLNIGNWTRSISTSQIAAFVDEWALYAPNHTELYPIGYIFGFILFMALTGN
jgi:hypothetical protein